MAENYDLIFGQGASSQYAWSDSDYQNGWKTVGSTPPTAEQFDALQRRSDKKAKDLNNRLSPLETTASKALARVTPAANMLPYFNSSNSATTTAISDFIKTLIDDKDAKTARATLGAPSTTGGGASGTWGINISGNAASATKATSATTAAACSGNSATATKLATPRTISLTGNATGAATFDGSKDVSINVTVNESKHAVNADKATNASSADSATKANKLASESGSNYLDVDTEEDSWSVIGSNPGNWLKSIRTEGSAPPYSIGHFSAAVAFGLFDTKGIITHAFDKPHVKFAGGSGSTANWKFTIRGGSNNEVYDLNNFPTKTGSGASGTWGIDISGNAKTATNASSAASATKATNDGNGANIASTYVKKAGDTTTGKITFAATDFNGLPEVKRTSGDGGSRIMSGIRFSSKTKSLGAVGKFLSEGEDLLNMRSDNTTVDVVLDSRNYNNYAPTKTGGGASGTWGINITGNADTATNADKLDGAHLADVYRQVGGHNTPTITSIIDWNTMKACNGGTDVRNINNTTYGVKAYGGDNNFSSGVLNGYAKGSFYLTQDYTNFDKLCFLFCSDEGEDIEYTMTDVFLLNYIMTNYSAVNLSHDDNDFWVVTGYSNKGTGTHKVSTKRIFSAESNNCGIVDVLGIKY